MEKSAWSCGGGERFEVMNRGVQRRLLKSESAGGVKKGLDFYTPQEEFSGVHIRQEESGSPTN